MLDQINDMIVALAAEPWIHPVVFALVVIDGFFPPLPSESVVVALGSLHASTGSPDLLPLFLVSAVGAAIGDNIAYQIGRVIGTERYRWMRSPRVAAAIEKAGNGLLRRAAVLIISARYIPVGRLAVNLTAGATGFPLSRFIPLSLIAGVSWAAYSIAIGMIAGAWFEQNPLLGAVIGIGVAILLGVIVDAVLQRVAVVRRRRRERERGDEAGGAARPSAPEV